MLGISNRMNCANIVCNVGSVSVSDPISEQLFCMEPNRQILYLVLLLKGRLWANCRSVFHQLLYKSSECTTILVTWLKTKCHLKVTKSAGYKQVAVYFSSKFSTQIQFLTHANSYSRQKHEMQHLAWNLGVRIFSMSTLIRT